jgi:hypothetical protein
VRKPRPNFSTSGNCHHKIPAIAKLQKNVKSKSFLNEKRYGFPLLRRQKMKTRFAWKRKKVRGKQGPIFPHLEIATTQKNRKNVKCKSFLSKKSYGFPLLRMQFSKTGFARKRKKFAEKNKRQFFHIWKFFAIAKIEKCKM